VKDQNVLQAIHTDPLKHTAGWVQFQSTTEMKDRTHVQDLDKLSTYGQDVLHLLVFVAREKLVELESGLGFKPFLHGLGIIRY
jgi:hypothetical protein